MYHRRREINAVEIMMMRERKQTKQMRKIQCDSPARSVSHVPKLPKQSASIKSVVLKANTALQPLSTASISCNFVFILFAPLFSVKPYQTVGLVAGQREFCDANLEPGPSIAVTPQRLAAGHNLLPDISAKIGVAMVCSRIYGH